MNVVGFYVFFFNVYFGIYLLVLELCFIVCNVCGFLFSVFVFSLFFVLVVFVVFFLCCVVEISVVFVV